jgi:hypothetical protein
VDAGGVLVVLAAGAVVVVGSDSPHDTPATVTGVLGQRGEQGVGGTGAAAGRIDVEVVEVAPEGGGRGPGEGADVVQTDDVPVG